jgi:hypothetical protein
MIEFDEAEKKRKQNYTRIARRHLEAGTGLREHLKRR